MAVHKHKFKLKSTSKTAHNHPFVFVQKSTKFGLPCAVMVTVQCVFPVPSKQIHSCKKKKIFKKKTTPTTVQICRLENIEHKIMKQVSYSGKYSFSACRAHQSHLQFSFVVRHVFCPRFLHV